MVTDGEMQQHATALRNELLGEDGVQTAVQVVQAILT
jgi:hypothetical protein